MLEEILQDLVNLTAIHVQAESDMEHEEFMQFLKDFIHPDEEKIEAKVPGFYVIFFEEHKQYGLLPING